MKDLLSPLLRASLACLALSLTACGGGSRSDGDGLRGAPTFAKSYGGPARDQATAAAPRPGGGYVFAGTLNSRGAGSGRINGLLGDGYEGDVWVTALDELGDVQWQRSYGRTSLLPAGARPSDVDGGAMYHQVRAAIDTENDGRRNGAWLVGYVLLFAPDATASHGYTERDSDLLITRLDGDNRVVFSRSYDSGPFRLPFFFSGEQTSEARTNADIWPTADGGAVAVADAAATVNDNGSARIQRSLYVLKVDAAGNRQASTLIPVDDNRYRRLLVRAAPDGAVVAYSTPAGMSVIGIDFATGSASIRWRRDFEGDEDPDALLVADDDGDGAPDGIVVAGTDQTRLANGFFGDHVDGFVIKLDPATGEQRWRRDFGNDVDGLVSTCGAPGAACRYAVAGSDGDDVLVRTLDVATGNTLAERRLAGSISSVSIRHLASTDRFQLFTDDGSASRDTRLVTLDAALGVSSTVAVPLAGLYGGSNLVADAGSSHLALFIYSHRLVSIDEFGVVSEVAALDAGETNLERGHALQRLPDGSGFVVAGEMSLRRHEGEAVDRAAWLLRLDNDGSIVWQKRFDGLRMATPHAEPGAAADLLRTSADGGLLIGGSTGGELQRIVKLDADGRIVWSTRALESGPGSALRALRAAADGGAYASGGTYSSGGSGRFWAARLDTAGALQWHFAYALDSTTTGAVASGFGASDMRITADGGSLLVGSAQHGTRPPPTSAATAIRLDADGRVVWANSYPFGQSRVHGNVRVAAAADGGFVIATTVQPVAEPGLPDLQLIKIDSDGAVQWSQRYGGLYEEVVHGLEATADGGFIVSAQSDSLGDYSEAWVLRVGADGRIVEGCNADRGRGGVVARRLPVMRVDHVLPYSGEAIAPAVITPVDTNVVARQPSDVVVARQCIGSASDDPGAPTNQRTLTVSQAGPLTGVVSSTPPGIVCGTGEGGGCSAAYTEGSLVTLRVDIGSVSNFSAWGAGCESTGGGFGEICSVRLDADKTIDVIFAAAPPPSPRPTGEFTLTVMIDRLGGFIGTTDGAIGCAVTAGQPRTCATRYPAGARVDLYAASLPGGNVRLESWQGDCAGFGAQANITLTMDRDHSCRAMFASAP